MKIDRKTRKRTPRALDAKSKVLAKSVRTPAQVAREFEKVKLANLRLEDRVADLERRTTNLEVVVSDLHRRCWRMIRAFLGLRLPTGGPKPLPPVLEDQCRISDGG